VPIGYRRRMRILAIAGSLRARSTNRTVLEAAALLTPPGVQIIPFAGLGELPLFNPDRDDDSLPPAVATLRAAVAEADGLLICSPEYARGVSAVLKNALEWLVSGPEFPGKPVAVINASQRSSDADSQLRLILQTMSARLIGPASITLPMLGRALDVEGGGRPRPLGRARAGASGFCRRDRLDATPGEELDQTDDDRDHQQQVDKPAADMADHTEQPEHDQDDGDGPEHGDLHPGTQIVRITPYPL